MSMITVITVNPADYIDFSRIAFPKQVTQVCSTRHNRQPMSDNTKRKISESNRGKIRTAEQRLKMSLAKKGKPNLNKGRSIGKGVKRSDEARRHISEGRKKYIAENRSHLVWHKLSPETKARISATKIQSFVDHPELREKYGRAIRKSRAEHPEIGAKISRLKMGIPLSDETRKKLRPYWEQSRLRLARGLLSHRGKNKTEQVLEDLINVAAPNAFAYNGDLRAGVMLNNKIPDFVNINGKKQVIELFGESWHQDTLHGEDNTKSKYAEVGWECLVIWGKELRSKCRRASALTKIKRFVGAGVKSG